jgi:hypothetical protein
LKAGKAGQCHILALRVDLDGVVAKILTEDLRHPRQMVVAGRRKFQRRAVGA